MENELIQNTPSPFLRYQEILDRYDGESRLRFIPADHTDGPGIDLVSNDYMGLGARWKEFSAEFQERFPEASFSSSASRLLSPRQYDFERLENLLAALYQKDVLLFNSGYHANVGVIQALNVAGTVFLCDKLIHASMIDGLSLAKAEFQRWRHNDIGSLVMLLEKHRDAERCIVVVESLYSMDGDLAPLQEIVDLKMQFPNMILYVDEAHAFGTLGNRGLGLSEQLGLIDNIDIIIGTLGKAAASSGAFVATHPLLKQYFLNTSRSFIFSTAIPPASAAWSHLMIEHLLMMKREREHLQAISGQFRKGLEKITGQKSVSESHIVPLMVGDAYKAMLISAHLSTSGINALPIRRPTVPPGTERIRFSLSANLSQSDIDKILELIAGAMTDINKERTC